MTTYKESNFLLKVVSQINRLYLYILIFIGVIIVGLVGYYAIDMLHSKNTNVQAYYSNTYITPYSSFNQQKLLELNEMFIEDTGGNSSIYKYTVQHGDTLSEIAKSFYLSVKELTAYNGIRNPNIINPGEVLKIPLTKASQKQKVTIASNNMNVNKYLTYNLKLPSHLTVSQINKFLEGTPMEGLGEAFINAEKKYGVNAKYLMSHAIHESNWGKSKIALQKHNLFGYQAYDDNPYGNAKTFTSYAESVDYTAKFISEYYLSDSGKYFNGPNLIGMNKNYATSQEWAKMIASIMKWFDKKAKI